MLPLPALQKDLLKCAWMLLPKFIFWKLWLERNNRLFRDVESTPSRIAMRAKALLGEALDHKPDLGNARPLEDREATWLSGLASRAHKTSITRPPTLADWEIRMEDAEFLNWRLSLQVHCLFFMVPLRAIQVPPEG